MTELELKVFYRELVGKTKKALKKAGNPLRNEDIADILGYTRSYFSTLLGNRGKVTEKHIKDFKLHFPTLEEPIAKITRQQQREPVAKDPGPDYREELLDFLRREVKEKTTLIESLMNDVKTDLQLLKANSTAMISAQTLVASMQQGYTDLFVEKLLKMSADTARQEVSRKVVSDMKESLEKGSVQPAGNRYNVS